MDIREQAEKYWQEFFESSNVKIDLVDFAEFIIKKEREKPETITPAEYSRRRQDDGNIDWTDRAISGF